MTERKLSEIAVDLENLTPFNDTDEVILKQAAAALVAAEKEIDRLIGRDPQCEKHGSGPGMRARCLVCAGMELTAALSQIDLDCDGGNEMNVSGYDLHCDPGEVVRHVQSVIAAAEKRVQPLVKDRDSWKAMCRDFAVENKRLREQLRGWAKDNPDVLPLTVREMGEIAATVNAKPGESETT